MAERLATTDAVELDDFVRAFEEVWARDGQADLSDFLPAPTHPLRLNVLRELVRVDLELRWNGGRPIPLADYRRRFPDLFTDPRAVAELTFEEYRLRRQAGTPVTEAEYRVAFGVDTSAWPVEEGGSAALAGPHRPFTTDVECRRLPLDFQPSTDADCDPDSWSGSSWQGSVQGLTGSSTTDPALAQLLARALPALPPDGTRFLGFHLRMELGRGAFGRVYLAEQGDLANRPVALKISVDLFRESQHLARLQHTHIVPIYSVHRAGPFQAVCMPYFGATTLADVLRAWRGQKLPDSGRALVQLLRVRQDAIAADVALANEPGHAGELPATLRRLEGLSLVQAVLWMAVRLADGLAHAHERGILHRDLKPANVLLTDDGQPMLLDFNLAADTRLLARASAAQVGGTLPYMAPEHLQAFRGNGSVDARSDLYSLGVILYELLTGRLPYPAHSGALDDVLAASVADRLQPPPRVRVYNRAVSPALESILRKLLAPCPADRYPSAQALREDLQRQLDNKPLRYAPEPSLRERLVKWVRRHPRLASPASVGALLLALAAGLLAWHAWQKYHGTHQQLGTTTEERDAFRQQAEEKQHEIDTKQHEVDAKQRQIEVQQQELHNTLDSLRWHETEALPLAHLADAAVFEKGQEDAYFSHCLAALGQYHVLDGPGWQEQPKVRLLPEERRTQLRRDMGELLFLLARTNLLDTPKEASLPGSPCRYGLPLPGPAVLALDAAAAVVRVRSQPARQWNAWARRCYPTDQTPPALLLQQALLARLDGKEAEAERLLGQVKATKPQSGRDRYLLACEYAVLGDFERALPLAHAARVENPRTWATWYLEGFCQAPLGHAQAALACFDTCLALKPGWLPALLQRGRTHLDCEHWPQGRADADRILTANPRLVKVLTWRAQALRGLKHDREALADWNRYLAVHPESLRGHLRRAQLHRDLGNLAAARQDLAFVRAAKPATAADFTLRGVARLPDDGAGALADYRRALELEPGYLPALENQAALLAERDASDAALKLLDRAVRLRPRSASTRIQRGLLRAQRGQRQAAHTDVEAALAGAPPPSLLYEAGCVYAQTSVRHQADRERALKLLTQAIEQGYDGRALAEDERLAPLHNDPSFRRLEMAAQVFTPGSH